MDLDTELTNERKLTQLTGKVSNGTDNPTKDEMFFRFHCDKLAKYGNPCVNSFVRKLGNFFQKLSYIFVVYGMIEAFYYHFLVFALNDHFYKRAYEPSSCPYYYAFDYENFTHHLRNNNTIENLKNQTHSLETTSEFSNNTIDLHIDCLYNNPIYFIFNCFYTYCVPTCICLAWFYTMDRRFGALILKHSNTTKQLRKHSLIVQIPIIVLFIPINLIIAFTFAIFFIPIIVIITILNWICKCGCCSFGLFDKMLKRAFKDSELLFLYLISMIINLFGSIGGLITIIATRISIISNDYEDGNDYESALFDVNLWFATVTGIIGLFYRMLNIYANRHLFMIFLETLNRILPIILSLWSQGDVFLDILQARKYYELAYGNKTLSNTGEIYRVSPLYFTFSIVSFVMPVLFVFVFRIYVNKGFKILRLCIGDKVQNEKPTKRVFISIFEVILGIPIYLISSVMFCYVVIPIILINHGLTVIREGPSIDDSIDIDPFKIFSNYFSATGILDFYGLKDFTSQSLPILRGFEQVGEASIQTVLAITFIVNNYDDITKFDRFLGVPFPTSILSSITSSVSLLYGLFQFAQFLYQYITKK